MVAERKRLHALHSSARTDWPTPDAEYKWLDACFGFTIDVCATAENAKHKRFFSPQDNALKQSWATETGFMNPPYGRYIGDWMAKAAFEAMLRLALVVSLVPARVDTKWWRRSVMRTEDDDAGSFLRVTYDERSRVTWYRWEFLIVGVHFHEQRIAFGDSGEGAPFPSAVVIFAHPSRQPNRAARVPDGCAWPLLTLGWPR